MTVSLVAGVIVSGVRPAAVGPAEQMVGSGRTGQPPVFLKSTSVSGGAGLIAAGVFLTLVGPTPAMAQTPAELKVGIDTVWVLITAGLVFFMNLGFALVESAMCRSKNTVNILSKNFIVFAISSLAFYLVGWGLMFGNGSPAWSTVGTSGAPERRVSAATA